MTRQKFAGARSASGLAVMAAFALVAATACGGGDTFASGNQGSGGAGGAAAGSGGSGTGGTGGANAGGTGGAAGGGAGGAAGTGTGGAGGSAGAPTCGTCDGCCVGSACIPTGQQSYQQCGANGNACTSCAYGVTCDSGKCTDSIDPNAHFNIVVDSVQVQPHDGNGNSWDPLGGAPDPQVCFDDGQGRNGCTNYCSDQESCTYSVADGTVKTVASVPGTGSTINFNGDSLSHLTMVVYDYDPTTGSDKVGSQNLQLQKYQATYSYSSFGQVVVVNFHLVQGQ